jgi:hypothetical protein
MTNLLNSFIKFPAAADPWYSQTERDNSVAFSRKTSRPYRFGHKNASGTNSLTTAKFLLKILGSPSGNISAAVFNGTSVEEQSSTDLDVTSISSSDFEWISFDFSGLDVVDDKYIALTTADNYGAGDDFVLVGVKVETGSSWYVNDGSTTWVEYTDRNTSVELL